MGSFHTRVVKVVEFQEELLILTVKVNYGSIKRHEIKGPSKDMRFLGPSKDMRF